MALPGETLGGVTTICEECGNKEPLRVLSTPGGYYVGYWCVECGPISRESAYFQTRRAAEKSLECRLNNPRMPMR